MVYKISFKIKNEFYGFDDRSIIAPRTQSQLHTVSPEVTGLMLKCLEIRGQGMLMLF